MDPYSIKNDYWKIFDLGINGLLLGRTKNFLKYNYIFAVIGSLNPDSLLNFVKFPNAVHKAKFLFTEKYLSMEKSYYQRISLVL